MDQIRLLHEFQTGTAAEQPAIHIFPLTAPPKETSSKMTDGIPYIRQDKNEGTSTRKVRRSSESSQQKSTHAGRRN